MTRENWNIQWEREINNKNSNWLKADSDIVELAHLLNPKKFHEVLDIGAGLGRHSILFAEKGFSVSALDISNVPLEILEKRAKDANLSIKTFVGDLSISELENRKYDVIICNNVLYHMPLSQIKEALIRIHTLLNPEGILYMTMLSTEDDKYQVGKEIEERTYDSNAKGHFGEIHHFIDKENLMELLKDFHVSQMKKSEFNWMYDNKKRFSSFWKICCLKKISFKNSSPL